MITFKDFLILFANSLDLEDHEINSETKLDALWQWDSVGKLSFLSELNSKINLTISSDQLNEFHTVNDIFVFLQKAFNELSPQS